MVGQPQRRRERAAQGEAHTRLGRGRKAILALAGVLVVAAVAASLVAARPPADGTIEYLARAMADRGWPLESIGPDQWGVRSGKSAVAIGQRPDSRYAIATMTDRTDPEGRRLLLDLVDAIAPALHTEIATYLANPADGARGARYGDLGNILSWDFTWPDAALEPTSLPADQMPAGYLPAAPGTSPAP